MATIRLRKGKYQVQVRRLGQRGISRSFIRLKDAQEWARTTEVAADRKELSDDPQALKRILLADLIVRYRDEVVSKKRGAIVETAVLNAFLRHPICKKSISDLSHLDFIRYRDERLKEVSIATIRRQINPIRHMFVIAIDEWGIPIKANPLSKIRFKGSDIRRERRLNEDEFQEIIQAANKTQTPHLASIIEFAIETGMRRGEMLAMRWKDVDLEKSQIKIPQTKTGIPRTIPITPRAKALLTGIQKQNGPVFELSANALQLAWQRLIKGLDVDDLHFHDLRHEAISRFFEMGLTMPEVATISGHQDVRMLLRYAHANINMLLKKFDTIN